MQEYRATMAAQEEQLSLAHQRIQKQQATEFSVARDGADQLLSDAQENAELRRDNEQLRGSSRQQAALVDRLQKDALQLETQLSEAKLELQRLNTAWNKERRDVLSEMQRLRKAPVGDSGAEELKARLKQCYLRFVRAERARKALIYQKKYLILLIGGFEACEEKTLSMIATMGVATRRENQERPLVRFRSAVYCVMAQFRMHKLVVKHSSGSRGGRVPTSPSRPNGSAVYYRN